MTYYELSAPRGILSAVTLCILSIAALAASATNVVITSRLTDKGLTEICIRSEDGHSARTYEVDLLHLFQHEPVHGR
jgi:hypothetical protein